jgi:uridine kinase
MAAIKDGVNSWNVLSPLRLSKLQIAPFYRSAIWFKFFGWGGWLLVELVTSTETNSVKIRLMFDELTKQIDELSGNHTVVVGISGFAGSGKTTLAEKLADHYEIKDSQIIHLDNIYTPLPRDGGLFDDYDGPLLVHILQEAKAGKDLNYQGAGFDGKPYPWRFSEKLPKVLLVEGIRLYRPELMSQFDLSIWIGCPPELALRRAKERDLKQGHDELYMKRWDTEWAPQNQKYFDVYRPDKLASMVYQDFGR